MTSNDEDDSDNDDDEDLAATECGDDSSVCVVNIWPLEGDGCRTRMMKCEYICVYLYVCVCLFVFVYVCVRVYCVCAEDFTLSRGGLQTKCVMTRVCACVCVCEGTFPLASVRTTQ